MDPRVKLEVLSAITGCTVNSRNTTPGKVTAGLLSLDEFHINTIVGGGQVYKKDIFINEEEFFDSRFNYDFTDLSDEAEFKRGDESYRRPKGWYRIALKVQGKYPDGDTWLGPDGWRRHSAPGEWPVSYHGTSLDGARGIIKSHYTAGGGKVYGRGIYSTPDIAESELYAKTFTSMTTGKHYKVIMQNRINPKMREIHRIKKDYWLIPVKEGTSAMEERKIVEHYIRPYGILIKQVGSNPSAPSDLSDSDTLVEAVIKACVVS